MMIFKQVSVMVILLVLVSSTVAVAQNLPPHVAGKVVAVSHQRVETKPGQWADEIRVKVDSCTAPGTLAEVVYSPATVSDRAALGHLFDENFHQARAALTGAPQPQVNGYGLFWVDANNHVQRTGILGHNVDCGRVPALLGQF